MNETKNEENRWNLISKLIFLQLEAKRHSSSMAAGQCLQEISNELLVALKMAEEWPTTEEEFQKIISEIPEEDRTFGRERR